MSEFYCNHTQADCRQRCRHIPEALEFLSVLNDENRLRLICVLSHNQGFTVGQVAKGVDLPQNLVSHHLSVLWQAGIVDKTKQGLKVYYRLKQEVLDQKSAILATLLNHN